MRFLQITDGLSNTFLLGEKHVPLGGFGQGWWDNSTFNGEYHTCYTRPAGPGSELAVSLHETGWKFGSYHTNLAHFGFADGSVRPIMTATSGRTLGMLAAINDGEVVPDL